MRSGRARGAVLALTLGLLAGCGTDTAEADLCTQYDDVVAQAENLRSWEPATDDVDELRDRAETFGAELDQLQAVSEGRLDSVISTLRTTINGFLASAVDQGQDALEAARPALEDAADEISDAWSVVELMAENECGAA